MFDASSGSMAEIPVVTPVTTGTPGIDAVIDLAGGTDLYCGPNQDFILFQHGSGFDYVFGFDPSDTGDVIAIEQNVNGSGLTAVDQLVITDTDTGAMVDLGGGGGNAFLLVGVSAGQLDASDFTIHPEITPIATVQQPVVDVPDNIPPPPGSDFGDLSGYYDAWYGPMGPSFVVI